MRLIRRERSKEDERVVMIKLTNTGTALKGKALCIPLSLLSANGMSTDELRTLNETINHLSDNDIRVSGK
ncbi:hypothetical protein [Paenibacillus phytorum]|uniref:hypothetical protein n=1 Tax=Paenibacillus phytorum TaxID=2654977 RepID=UPI0014912703|nr:hypothetical protein [Paenibacillus phytorum]